MHMEVHHHPDLHHEKKKFKEYLLEFVMIFLAVTLGFFAETIREKSLPVRILFITTLCNTRLVHTFSSSTI
jgi:hypothetical protein